MSWHLVSKPNGKPLPLKNSAGLEQMVKSLASMPGNEPVFIMVLPLTSVSNRVSQVFCCICYFSCFFWRCDFRTSHILILTMITMRMLLLTVTCSYLNLYVFYSCILVHPTHDYYSKILMSVFWNNIRALVLFTQRSAAYRTLFWHWRE